MVWLIIAALGVVLVGVVTWTGVRAALLRVELDSAVAQADALGAQLAASDVTGAMASAESVSTHARAAMALSGDPIWRAAELVPIAGENLRAARVVSTQLVALSEHAVAPGLSLAAQLGSSWSADGLDLDVLVRGSRELGSAVEVIQEARAQLDSLDRSALIGPIEQGVDQLDGYLAQAEPMLRDASVAAGVIPSILGKDGPRSILVMVQNGAELRTAGGLTGAFAELRADRGSLEILDQASSSEFPWLDEPIAELPTSVSALFDDAVGRFVMNISTPTDFALSAALASEWWELHSGHRPDTVIAVDIHVLGALLGVVGPVEVRDWGQLTTDNLVQRLLVDPYVSLPSGEQDALFQRSVRTVFTRALESSIDPAELLKQLAAPVKEGRVSVWSADPAIQTVLGRTAVAGAHARQLQAGDDAFAVYLNDITGAKMDTYLGVGIDARVSACRADDLRDITVSVTLTNTAPADAGAIYPVSVTGGGLWGVPAGDIGTLVAVSAPPGTFIGGVTQGGELVRSISGDLEGSPVTQSQVTLSPGASATREFHFVAAKPGDVELEILHTPLLTAPDITRTDAAPCD